MIVNEYIFKQQLARLIVLGTTGDTYCLSLFPKVVYLLIGEVAFNEDTQFIWILRFEPKAHLEKLSIRR